MESRSAILGQLCEDFGRIMRFKIEIEEKYQTHQDSSGQPHFDWRAVCSAWATETADGWLIKYTDKVKPKMQAVGNSRIMTIGKVEEVEDGGIRFLKLTFDSARGIPARARPAPKPAGLPDAQDEHGDNGGD